MPSLDKEKNLLALDIGEKRVGVALARHDSPLAQPLITLAHDDSFLDQLEALVNEHSVATIIIGLPRGLSGQETDQTASVKRQAQLIKTRLSATIEYQDEALTSVKAKQELTARGKVYLKSDIDKLAACYILEDYIQDQILKRA